MAKRKAKRPKKHAGNSPHPSRLYKARLFEMIFRDKTALLELYNSINGTAYTDPEELQITTLENAIYLSMHNDISFIIDFRLNLYEHQSTFNPNIPLRFLFYVSDTYSDYTKDANLYGKTRIKIPTPHFLVFYNGEDERPDREILRLSDLFEISDPDPGLELQAIVLNINPGHNTELLSICKTLSDFSEYSWRVRTYTKEMSLEDAVEKAITECIQEGILSDFLRKNRAEAKAVSIYEYDEKKHIAMERAEAFREGKSAGRMEGILEGRAEGKLEERVHILIAKIARQYPLSTIAEHLELPADELLPLYNLIQQHSPDYDIVEIMKDAFQE